jgi:LuxR family transcriptional regulator, maltose regulon positive regulatory protein
MGARAISRKGTAIAASAATGTRPVRHRVWSSRPPAGAVRRPRLVRALAAVDAPPLLLLTAPAGFGKTAVLREWEATDPRAFAWVTLDERHDHGARLLAAVARAVDAAVGAAPDAPFVLVLDDAHVVRSGLAVEALKSIANDLPAHARLAVASRAELPVAVPRLRAQNLVLELRGPELALTRAEAASVLRAAGHMAEAPAVESLLERTEGWPVAIALAARYLDERRAGASLDGFEGSDRLIVEYAREEILRALPPELLRFAVHTSVAETLSAEACDALLDESTSAAQLAALAQAGLIVPLDRVGRRFRYLHLLGAALRAELHRGDPRLEAGLHRRAAAWHLRAGDVDRAVAHALAGGDVAAAGGLVWRGAAACVGAGRAGDVERWLSRVGDGEIAGDPRLALTAASCALARGQGQLVEHWARAAAAAAGHGAAGRTTAAALPGAADRASAVPPAGAADRASAAAALLRTAVSDAGAAAMRAGALRWHAAGGDGALWDALACFVAGAAAQLAGDRAEAMARLQAGARASAVAAPHVQVACLAQLTMLALDADDRELAVALSTRARAQVERYGLGDLPPTALALAASALVRAHRGLIEAAQADLRAALQLRAALTDFPAWYEAEVALLCARAALKVSDVSLCRDQLAVAARLLERVPSGVVLQAWLSDARAELAAADAGPAAMLTAAELRVLHFMPTHLSFREIAGRTFVSPNTVKTQANAVYRKLGVSGRSEAVDAARACGLLDY